MAFFKKGDVERHEVVSPQDNSRLNEMRKTGAVKLDDLTDEEYTEYTDPVTGLIEKKRREEG
jgi:hypothetical protein